MEPAVKIRYDHEKLAELCRRWKVKRLAFFGSVLRDDFGPESDVDVLYEFEPDAVIGWHIVSFENELSALFGGRKVDLVPFEHISRFIRKRVLREAQLAYAA
ncbi:MAG: nucleotidyltransferase family protein [Planctomycetes bacterium]|nr:nucleotidyltransferase family protein [Planctomycetota bacterium]MCW8135023.1 nucleotidyltransferase family protein [Planctomycetota bacterium]